MLKIYEVMTYALATVAPDASLAQVAAIMRDRDIGDVLVIENGKLRGIVTDRDLALHALTSKEDPLQVPIRKFMSTKVITGETDWSLERVAATMTRYQIRRLPIVQGEQLVGIVSLGDIARHESRKEVVTKSLQAVSKPVGSTMPDRSRKSGAWKFLTLAAFATATIVWLTWNSSGQTLRKQMLKSELYHNAQHVVNSTRDRIDEAASSKPVQDLLYQLRLNLNELSAQLPALEYKLPKS